MLFTGDLKVVVLHSFYFFLNKIMQIFFYVILTHFFTEEHLLQSFFSFKELVILGCLKRLRSLIIIHLQIVNGKGFLVENITGQLPWKRKVCLESNLELPENIAAPTM